MDGVGVSGGSHFNPVVARVEGRDDACRMLVELGVDGSGISIMSRKMGHLVIRVENVQARAAHIIKQVMLSKGGECATPRDVFFKDTERVDVLMMGTPAQLSSAIKNLSAQPFELSKLAAELKELMEHEFPSRDRRRTMECGPYTLDFLGRTLVMGVINVTPDSFSDPGRFFAIEEAEKGARSMVSSGVDVLDIGGESTRPGSEPVSLEEELERTIPLIEALADVEVPISIDTCKAGVARRALEAGASMINDVSALRSDEEMVLLARDTGTPVILMHMQGTPRDMQDDPRYDDVVRDIARFLRERAAFAREAGVDPTRIVIDPGIGFGKTVEHNLEIIRRIEEFSSLGYPVLLGPSRKRFIGEVLNRPVEERLLGTAATLAFAISRGVDMVRVHDAEQMVEVVRMADALAGKHRPLDEGS